MLRRWIPMCALVLSLQPAVSDSPGLAAGEETYLFTVFLKDDPIGTQRFVVSSSGGRTRIEIEARFEVTFWLFTAYTYRHDNTETWENSCLREIRATTNDNGESFFVRGSYQDGALRLRTHEGRRTLSGCVRTFAYWDVDLLQVDRLLNSQTGEYQAVEVQRVGRETIPVQGASTPTERYRVTTDAFTIDLWYTPNGDWVALQSTTKGGEILRYRLQ